LVIASSLGWSGRNRSALPSTYTIPSLLNNTVILTTSQSHNCTPCHSMFSGLISARTRCCMILVSVHHLPPPPRMYRSARNRPHENDRNVSLATIGDCEPVYTPAMPVLCEPLPPAPPPKFGPSTGPSCGTWLGEFAQEAVTVWLL
jgi:hypothetical protein